MKKLMKGIFVLVVTSLCVFTLQAADKPRVELVSNNNKSINVKRSDTIEQVVTKITNQVNTTKTDWVNGKVVVDVNINNSVKTEVLYLVENSTEVLNAIKNEAKKLENYDNLAQGIIYTSTSSSSSYQELETKNIDEQFNIVTTDLINENSDYVSNLQNAITKFSANTDNKIIVMTISSLPEDTTALESVLESINDEQLYVYGIDIEDTETFNTLFSGFDKSLIETSNLSTINFVEDIKGNSLSPLRENVTTTISFHDDLLNNFEVTDVKTFNNNEENKVGTISYENKMITFNGTINQNQNVTIRYTLKLKSEIDGSYKNVPLRTDKQIKVIGGGLNGSLPDDDKLNDLCSPEIMILEEAIDNPVTGILDSIIFGACLLAVALVTLVIMNNKKEFNRI